MIFSSCHLLVIRSRGSWHVECGSVGETAGVLGRMPEGRHSAMITHALDLGMQGLVSTIHHNILLLLLLHGSGIA
jgi:hypothetical protein